MCPSDDSRGRILARIYYFIIFEFRHLFEVFPRSHVVFVLSSNVTVFVHEL